MNKLLSKIKKKQDENWTLKRSCEWAEKEFSRDEIKMSRDQATKKINKH